MSPDESCMHPSAEEISVVRSPTEMEVDPEIPRDKQDTPLKQQLHRGLKPRHLSMIGERRTIFAQLYLLTRAA